MLNDKGSVTFVTEPLEENLGIVLLSHARIRSIMGDEELDYRVRNGIGYTLFSMDAKEISKYIIDRGEGS